ncbi:MAG: class I SAM-dependent methyltransferase [Thaumarchaeota archaeon]|nr:class I SAM-dependent methyltransferase [Nitrososphaerota archaeon]
MKKFVSFAISHPNIVLRVLLKKNLTKSQREQITLMTIEKIESECSFGKESLLKFHREIKNNHDLIDYISKSLENLTNTGAFNPTFQTIVYSIIRYLKPEYVVETGVANGVSSTIILQALELNNNGFLYSIDLPVLHWENTEYRKVDKVEVKNDEVGWLVPSKFQKKWILSLGKSRELLPEIFNKIKKCEVFFHDSEHSFDNMMFEFNTAWPYITNGGIILADDVNRNTAFDDFVNDHKDEVISLKIGQFGFIMKKSTK